MDTDNPSIPIRAKITVASELEPVEVDGYFRETPSGYTLSFIIDKSDYKLTVADGVILLDVKGLISYSIDFSKPNVSTLATVFGALEFNVEPLSSDCKRDGDSLFVMLRYALNGDGQKTVRDVKLSARLIK